MDKYKKVKVIGKGAFGAVFLGMNEDTGELLNMEDTISAIEDDYLARPSQAAPLPTEARRQMETWVSEARARAMAAVELETEDAFEESQVDVVLDKLDDVKASFRFPRRAARRSAVQPT